MIYRDLCYKDYRNYINLIQKYKNIDYNESKFRYTLDKINNNGKIIICEHNNQIIGTITILIDYKFIHNFSKYAHFEDVFIDPNHQKKGICRNLLNLGITYAKSNKCLKIKLNCVDKLKQLYEKFNFEKNGISMYNIL